MKKALVALATMTTLVAGAQTKGNFEVLDCTTFKVHVYNSNDVMADASYIIEGKKGLVLMELPLFKENSAEFNAYVKKLNKPIEKVITDYHLGGSDDHEITEPEGMPAFIKGDIYGGMMKHFGQVFGEAMVSLPTAATQEVAFGSTHTWAGVTFTFEKGASTDFPAASIIIGKKVYYTHWTPAKAHPSNLQFSSSTAVDAELKEAQKALKSGCKYFAGGHGGLATIDALEFKIEYLNTVNKLLNENKTAQDFVSAMKSKYPSLAGENNLSALAEALYK